MKEKGFKTCGKWIWDIIHDGTMTSGSLQEMTNKLTALIGYEVTIEVKAQSLENAQKGAYRFINALMKGEKER